MNSFRPAYHFRPARNWMNDPNGPIAVNGEYHLFYQYNPNGDEWGTIHWGHAKSKDLVHWEHLPVALYPSEERGEQHCFSGCTVVHEGRPAILYTSIGPGDRNPTTGAQQWIAYGDAEWLKWEKPGEGINPILTSDIHGDLDIREWRDPYVWKMEDGLWHMVCGGTHGGRGCAVLYRSPDLLKWEFLGIAAEGEARVWECPNLFRLGGKWVLTYSPDDADNRVRYRVGELTENFRFVAEREGILDYGGREGFYAATTFEDERGRRILLGWMPDSARGTSSLIRGWSGVHALPRVLTLDPDTLRLRAEPIPELNVLRGRHWKRGPFAVTGEVETDIAGQSLELSLVLKTDEPNEGGIGLRLFRSPDGEEETVLEIDRSRKQAVLHRAKSSLDAGTHRHALAADLPQDGEGDLRLRLFLDRSTLEVFINEEVCLSARVYPMREDSSRVSLFSFGSGGLEVASLEAWVMKPVWEE